MTLLHSSRAINERGIHRFSAWARLKSRPSVQGRLSSLPSQCFSFLVSPMCSLAWVGAKE